MPEPLRVLIVGAGTGGLCLAHGLKRAGIRVTVFERDRTRSDGLQGYRVGISPGGSQALAACLPPELFHTFVATCARTPRYFNLLTEGMAELLSLSLSPEEDPLQSEKSVSRMTLRQVLLTGLEDTVQFGKTFARYQSGPDGTVTAFFEDGSSATGDLLVAADGTNSRIRRQYLPQARLEDSGILAVGAKVPLTWETRRLLPPRVLEGISMVLAPRGYSLILHVMEFSWDRQGVRSGIGGNDAELIRRWPGLLYDNTTDYIMWGFSGARQNFPVDPQGLRGPALVDLVRGMTPGWHPDLRELFRLSDPGTAFPINIRTSVPQGPWAPGRVTLLGDAIHTMTPGRGIGANTALRDAALLCRKLAAVRDGALPLLAAVGEYEAEMREYGYRAVLDSRAQMDGRGPLHRPIIGSLMLGMTRTGLRLVNAVPPLKRRMTENLTRPRGARREAGGA
ncbi:FAD-dependent oxidoreductase [Deinococcus apachensis]|uniref:FAD-dependent oxidoreductase n=1 Tax=Deinococcus apachensis TaxID=309886 RepID=UPI00036CB5E9|nr:NAD(P)/FAD-dependent oxidoreductase [Deinococcus apachensis]